MTNSRKITSFVPGRLSKARQMIKTTPGLNKKLQREIKNIRRGGNLQEGVQRLFFEAIGVGFQGIVKSTFADIVKVDTAAIAADMIGSDNSGTAHMISGYESLDNPTYGTELINVKRHVYKVYLNRPTFGKFKEKPHGYTRQTKQLMSTKRDYLATEDRIALLSNCGFGEALVDIMDYDSFLTMEDSHILTDCSNKINEYKKEKRKELSKSISSSIDKGESRSQLKRQLALTQISEIANDRIYSKMLKYRNVLEIHAENISYITKLKVHLCSHKRFANCDGKDSSLTTEALYNGIINDIDSVDARSIKKANLIGQEGKGKAQSKHIKKSMLVTPGTRVLNSETVIDNVQVMRTFEFILKPSETAVIDLTNNFPRGIDLFDLGRCQINESSATTFYIVEAVGDQNARISDIKNPSIRHTGYSPIKLRYEIKKEISFISQNKTKDIPSVLTHEGVNRNFEDFDLAESFYPNRRPALTVPLSKLDINGNNPKAKYTLDLDAKTTTKPTILDRAQSIEKSRFIDLENAKELAKFVKETTENLVESSGDHNKDFYGEDNFLTPVYTEDEDNEEIIDLDSNEEY